MSVNITVNGKFSKHSQIFNPEGYKKQLETERRKLRLQQVREQSRELAQKIRKDVAEEKKRQLRNLEATKEQELNLWRKNIVGTKLTDYRKSINEVGSAHRAARMENALSKEKMRQSQLPKTKKISKKAEDSKTVEKEETQKPEKSKIEEPKEKNDDGCNKKGSVYFLEKCDMICMSTDTTDSDDDEYDEIKLGTTDFDFSDSSLKWSDDDICCPKESKSTQTVKSKDIVVKPDETPDVNVETIRSESTTNKDSDSVTDNDKSSALSAEQLPSETWQRPRYTQISDFIAIQKERYDAENALITDKEAPKTDNVQTGVSYTVIRETVTSNEKSKESEIVSNTKEPSSNVSVLDNVASTSKNIPIQLQNQSKDTAIKRTALPEKKSSPVKRISTATGKKLSTAADSNSLADSESRDEVLLRTQRLNSNLTTTSQERRRTSPAKKVSYAPEKKTSPIKRTSTAPGKKLSTASKSTESREEVHLRTQQLSVKPSSSQQRRTSASVKRLSTVPENVEDAASKEEARLSAPPPSTTMPVRRNPPVWTIPSSETSTRRSTPSRQTTSSSKDSVGNAAAEKAESVQFYDYNNKYSKEYEQPPNAMALEEENFSEPNAMEEAEIEKERLSRKEEDDQLLREKSEMRGKIALDRERVRRDCADLASKLDALMQNRQSLLPTDAPVHSHAYFAGKIAQKEAKMNNAIEELLSRPAIITCPERRKETPKPSSNPQNPLDIRSSDLNIGTRLLSGESDNIAACKSLDTDSSGSILLGYIDDQRHQIRSELSQNRGMMSTKENIEKNEKLTLLLLRIESLRESLLEELEKKPGESYKELIGDGVSKQSIITKETTECIPTELPELTKREKKLKEKEIRLQKELEAVIQTQQKLKAEQQAKSAMVKIISGKDQFNERTIAGKPLEIVIKVKSDSKSTKRKTQNKIEVATVAPPSQELTNRRRSYDSNSTAYRSMPSALNVMPTMKNKEQFKTISNSSSMSVEQYPKASMHQKQRSNLNPLISQYVQRLLGMTRDSVRALEVSSSEIESPSSSVMNISTNVANTSVGRVNTNLSEDRLRRVEQFVNDNRDFIHELEESLRTHGNETLETSLRNFENIWKEKLKRDAQQAAIPSTTTEASRTKKSKEQIKKDSSKKVATKQIDTESKSSAVKPSAKVPEKISSKKVQSKSNELKKPSESSSEDIEKKSSKETRDANATQMQLNEYAELTKSCSKRIAELTALITKVRQEKQRILEVTLTSVSDNERHSTEYNELPAAQIENENKKDTDTARKSKTEKISKQQGSIAPPAPLEKYKQTGRSRDSGISLQSRPVTALGHENHDNEPEPQSFASSTRTITFSQSTISNRRSHPPPPPTINRFSPQLPEDEVVHELSTIVEVDTPATSRINTSMQQQAQQATSHDKWKPKPFPTFDQYVKELNLDLSTMDPEESLRMEHEYNELINALKSGKSHDAYVYEEFPTLTTYLKSLTENDECSDSPETVGDLFNCLRLAKIIAKPFPSHKEYVGQLSVESINKFLDSESLENLTERHSTYTESDSETLNIEGELKRRNILKKSFLSSTKKCEDHSTSDSKKQSQSKSKSSVAWTTIESGTAKLTSSSPDSSEKIQRELLALGVKWHKSMRSKEKAAAALSDSTSDRSPMSERKKFQYSNSKPTPTPKATEKKKEDCKDLPTDSEHSDHPLNLRDFLTRQLLKHVTATSADSSLSGESLRSQFFMAVLDSMTPSGSPRDNSARKSVGNTNIERQKTSTPTMQSRMVKDRTKSNNETSQTQLFSAESNLSAVQFPQRKSKNSKNNSKDKNTK